MIRLLCVALITACGLSQCSQPPSEVEIKNIRGAEASIYQDKLSNFYDVFYQSPPYRYHARKTSWDGYVASYFDNPESILCLVLKEGEIIGAAMGTPLKDASEKYRAGFMDHPQDLNTLFYLGELAVKEEYRGLGIGNKLYAQFEQQVKERKKFSGICLWQLDSEANALAGKFWKEQGFKRHPEIRFQEMWREDPNPNALKIPHEMVCWKKLFSDH